jgi:hypothetical protein
MRACCVPARARDSGLALGAKLLPGAPNPDKHFQWDWRVPSSLRTVGHAPGAWAWPDPAHRGEEQRFGEPERPKARSVLLVTYW